MERAKPTGRKRYRVLHRWFRKPVLVLQIEINGLVTSWAGNQVYVDEKTWWMDCPPELEMTHDK